MQRILFEKPLGRLHREIETAGGDSLLQALNGVLQSAVQQVLFACIRFSEPATRPAWAGIEPVETLEYGLDPEDTQRHAIELCVSTSFADEVDERWRPELKRHLGHHAIRGLESLGRAFADRTIDGRQFPCQVCSSLTALYVHGSRFGHGGHAFFQPFLRMLEDTPHLVPLGRWVGSPSVYVVFWWGAPFTAPA